MVTELLSDNIAASSSKSLSFTVIFIQIRLKVKKKLVALQIRYIDLQEEREGVCKENKKEKKERKMAQTSKQGRRPGWKDRGHMSCYLKCLTDLVREKFTVS